MDVVNAAEKDEVKDYESNQGTAGKKYRVPKGKPEGDSSAQPRNLI
ncbi:hypothetical protein [Syntrophorhabdus aromaticivorans]|nr:hypothetical protein [Syntrophorhabdus aromaticivorans]OPX97093.1 MAG: hypothetical protein A4E58_01521 [Syntrophorhabdus sp. PtaB.Bin006]